MNSPMLANWIELFKANESSLFLSNEMSSWTYGELLVAVREINSQLDGLQPGICLIESDYGLYGVAWLISGLLNRWTLVPVVSDNSEIVVTRARVSRATHRVSADTGWKLRSIGDQSGVVCAGDYTPLPSVILFSSGTTGEPKAMRKELDFELSSSEAKKRKTLNMGLLLLFDHIGGLNTLVSGLRKGAHLVAPIQRNPRSMAELIERFSVSVLPCSPTFLNMMCLDGIFEDFGLNSLRLVTYGTERMPDELLVRLSKHLPKTRFLQTFGTSETGIVKTKSYSSSSTFLTIDDPSVDWKVVDNELWLKAKGQISEYINVDDEVISDGWFKTGDLLEVREDGYFKVVGRKSEVINVGGEKVVPAEVEDVILTIGDVVDCTAFSMPNGMTGQAVAVRVVPKKGVVLKDLKLAIRQVCTVKLERYKIPVKIIFESDLKHTDRFKKEK